MKRILLLALLLFSINCPAVNAQLNEQYAQQSVVSMRHIDRLSSALESFHTENKALPHQDSDVDKFLVKAYKGAMNETPTQDMTVRSVGNQRVFGTLHMFYDERAGQPTMINGQYKLPDDWATDPGHIAIITDGKDHAFIFMGGMDNKPQNTRMVDLSKSNDDAAADGEKK